MTPEYLNNIKNTCTKAVYRAICNKKCKMTSVETTALARVKNIHAELVYYNELNLGIGPECRALRKAYKRFNRQLLLAIKYAERNYRYKKDLERVFPVED